ncbi:MAG: PH domain-containing protein [Candidatus Brockarchaeota archaeon]|nr:PH domain-containing protein [Candidatus Brockarchaeota archaeon]
MRDLTAGKPGKAEGSVSPERVLWSGKPTVLAFYDVLVGGALLIVVSALVFTSLPFTGLLSAIGVVCGFLLIALAFVNAWANTYIVADRCVRRRYSFVAVRVEEAVFDKITNTVSEQGVVGRIFGFGDIRFDTAGTLFMGVLFKGVRNPAEVKRLVDEGLKELEKSRG